MPPNFASREKSPHQGEGAFVIRAQARTTSRERALRYDGLASGATVYAYVNENPLSGIDPNGLDDTVCMYNAGMCGMEKNAPASDSFAFVSVEKPLLEGLYTEGEAEGVFIVGRSQADGWYTATIAAGGVQVGFNGINYSRFQGTEESRGRVFPITLNEGNLGESIVKLGGFTAGAGTYSTHDPCTGAAEGGAYVHAAFILWGRHFAVGIGGS